MDFRLPPLGEGIDSATVVSVKVKPGDAVSAGQEVAEVETDKASMPITAEAGGTVQSVAVKPGDKVNVGAVLLTFGGNGVAKPAPAPVAPPPPPPAAPVKSQGSDAPRSPEPAAPSRVEFKLPPLGEGIDAATVVAVKVKAGDTLTAGQDLLEVETDKASMPVPSEVAGKVEEVRVKAGDKVNVGAIIAVITGTAPGHSTPPSAAPAVASPPPAAANTQLSVKAPAGVGTPTSPTPAPAPNGKKDLTPAGPATRRLARELGVALLEVRGSGRGGRVTLDDVKGFVRTERQQVKAGGGGAFSGSVVNAFTLPPLPDFAKFGEIEKKPVAKIRETIAKNLTIAWRTMPMVTQNDLADITDLEAGRKRIVETLPKGAPKITWTVLAVKACVAALKEFPHFNASYDMNAGELILKKYFHIGIAVDTERGLVVPVIKDADKKSIRDIATEVQTLAEKARAGKLGIDEMRGGTFTITNLGGIGGTSFTPIVNYPEVAILGMCRSALQPVVKDGQIVPRLMLPLSLTYDHRVIDGADGARFTSRLVQLFSDPMRLLMES
ncbi:MAG: 2-oxo acid dehydrogenase subunit E2 [Fimbriiglobus sp.]|nr:2-oxo acid dehydrogenase subunit E2 [Fimbriiglobus sp.]